MWNYGNFYPKMFWSNCNNLGDDFNNYSRKRLFWGLKKRLKLFVKKMPKVVINDRESVFVIQTVRTARHRGQSLFSGSRLLEFIVFVKMC